MTFDPVVLALRAALKARDSLELRLTLGEHLLRKDSLAEALAEFERALGFDPSHPRALEGAATAAERLGDVPRAQAYRLALGALGSASPSPEAPPGPVSPGPAAGPVPHEGEHSSGGVRTLGMEAERSPRLRLVANEGALLDESLASETPVTFADVAGMEAVKGALNRSFLLPLKNPELYRRFGKRTGGGLVLYGPPGCGKTFIARALAGELGARFLNVGLSDVLDMWFGESEKRLHTLFENARRAAPCVLFFDEVDALGQRRTQLRGAAGRTLVNQLLSELDGFEGRSEQVYILAATNHPWDLDPALRRPGRFDRLVFVPPPDLEARRETLALKLRERPTVTGMDLGAVARVTEGFSGADLSAVVERATEYAVEQSVSSGREVPIDVPMLQRALRDVRPSTRPWLETARNFALYSNEGGVYEELLGYLKRSGLV